MAAITAPDAREPDVRAGRERYFHRGRPLRWIRVVTELSGSRDRVVTASDSSGFVHDPDGISGEKLAWLKDLKELRRGRIEDRVTNFAAVCLDGLVPEFRNHARIRDGHR